MNTVARRMKGKISGLYPLDSFVDQDAWRILMLPYLNQPCSHCGSYTLSKEDAISFCNHCGEEEVLAEEGLDWG
ncbi:hypothetical protein KIN_39450 [Litoreibacter roseus]|uniref:Uncharacterized protein n=1 Tax=Litoreibacter roseus TaxID=2601869 RepID=A0A6N6JKN4_9RHOB|nr:hypothetical protein KIN_39450 [Litoreibacter roseus]